MRRRRQPNAPGRSKSRKVTLTPEQDAALQLKARRLKVSVARLLVESALTDQETATDRRELLETLFGLQRLLGNVANNVNQLARKANIEDEFPEAARPVLLQMLRLMKRLDLAVDELGMPGRSQGGGAR
ncbi:plasmid mobilization protein [Kribbella sp. NPDC048928]|uniref:plasmid mobilization protein n=1 Tax=Kribbella sp. NPDC048928 TaxID=3364111 RepID=UPI0037210D41